MQADPSVGQLEDFPSPTGVQPDHVTPPPWSQPYGIPSTSPEEVPPWWVYAMIVVGIPLMAVGVIAAWGATPGNLDLWIVSGVCLPVGIPMVSYGRILYRDYSTNS